LGFPVCDGPNALSLLYKVFRKARTKPFQRRVPSSMVPNLAEAHEMVSGGISVEPSGPLVLVGDPTPLVTELVTAQVSSPVSSTLVATPAPDCEDASSAVRASGLPFVPETYVAGDGSTTDEGSAAGEGSVSGDGSDGEARLPVPGSPAEDLLAPKSR
jgi:hypothetical protein